MHINIKCNEHVNITMTLYLLVVNKGQLQH